MVSCIEGRNVVGKQKSELIWKTIHLFIIIHNLYVIKIAIENLGFQKLKDLLSSGKLRKVSSGISYPTHSRFISCSKACNIPTWGLLCNMAFLINYLSHAPYVPYPRVLFRYLSYASYLCTLLVLFGRLNFFRSISFSLSKTYNFPRTVKGTTSCAVFMQVEKHPQISSRWGKFWSIFETWNQFNVFVLYFFICSTMN